MSWHWICNWIVNWWMAHSLLHLSLYYMRQNLVTYSFNQILWWCLQILYDWELRGPMLQFSPYQANDLEIQDFLKTQMQLFTSEFWLSYRHLLLAEIQLMEYFWSQGSYNWRHSHAFYKFLNRPCSSLSRLLTCYQIDVCRIIESLSGGQVSIYRGTTVFSFIILGGFSCPSSLFSSFSCYKYQFKTYKCITKLKVPFILFRP